MTLLLVGLGGALGSMARHLLNHVVHQRALSATFPLGRKAIEKTTRLGREAFDRDENLRLAPTHLVQVIGEAARHVSREFSAKPWRNGISGQLDDLLVRIPHNCQADGDARG